MIANVSDFQHIYLQLRIRSIPMAEEKDPFIGTVIREYTLTRLLGEGAMGRVYLGQRQDGLEVAVKFLSGEFASKTEFVNRFLNEASFCATLDHENIVHVYDAGVENDLHFMVMEYVQGVDLSHFLKVQDKAKEAQALPWIRQTAQALQYAHSKGIVHRDIKPENIMLTQKGLVKITDLGLSKSLDSTENYSMTMSGTVIGTPYYISPEQVRNAKHVDVRTDMYSLGAAFYHLITGTPPFQGDSAVEVMSKHMNDPLPHPQRKNPHLSDGFSDLILKMMEKDPTKRFQTMDELIQAIDRLEKGESVTMQRVKIRPSEFVDTSKPSMFSASWLRWTLGGAGFLIIVVLMALFGKGGAPAPVKQPSKKPIQASAPQKITPTPTPIPKPTPEPEPTPEKTVTQENPSPEEVPPTPSPAPVEKPIKKSEPITTTTTSEESTMNIGESEAPPDKGMSLSGFKGSVNWVDGFAVLIILIGIMIAREQGWVWSSIRASAVWVGVILTFCFYDYAAGFFRGISVPRETSSTLGFAVASVIFITPAWVFTHQLLGLRKETWKLQLNRSMAVIPGIVLGAALSVWLVGAFLVITNSLPMENSWIASRITHHFPALKPTGSTNPR